LKKGNNIMSIHFYKNASLDISKIADSLVNLYSKEHFETQQLVEQDRGFVQLKKESVLRAVTGFGKAITIRMQRMDRGLHVQVSMEDWAAKLAAEGITFLFVSMIGGISAVIGTADEIHLAHKVLDEVDQLVREQDPTIEIEHHEPKEK
jgi:hypothetical protein